MPNICDQFPMFAPVVAFAVSMAANTNDTWLFLI